MEFFKGMMDNMTVSDRKTHIEKAKKLKNDGNDYYRKFLEEYKKSADQRDVRALEKLQREAKRAYHLAKLEAQAAFPFSPKTYKADSKARPDGDGPSTAAADDSEWNLKDEWSDLLASIFNNLAATILAYPEGQKQSDYGRAAEYCDSVLAIQKDNAKAMYRKAQALEKMGHLKRALTYYRDADLAEKHQNAAVKRDLIRLQGQLAEAKKQSNEDFKEKFQRGVATTGLGLTTDARQYGKREKKKRRNRDADSPSRGSSCSSQSSSDSRSSSSGRASD